MHNLFLGTAKKVFGLKMNFSSKKDLETISDRIAGMNVSSDIGRLPSNIASNYGIFTARRVEKFGSVVFSVLSEWIREDKHLKIWQNLVLACRHLCHPTVPKARLRIHRLFLIFARDGQSLYEPNLLTPNIHLHGHIMECMEYFGSLYGF